MSLNNIFAHFNEACHNAQTAMDRIDCNAVSVHQAQIMIDSSFSGLSIGHGCIVTLCGAQFGKKLGKFSF